MFHRTLRAVLEITSLILAVLFVVLEVANAKHARKAAIKLSQHMKQHLLSISGLCCIFVCAACRFAHADDVVQVSVQSICVVLVWLRLLFLMRHHPRLGSFFIMVVDMIESDVSKFMSVLYEVLCPVRNGAHPSVYPGTS